MSKFWAKVKFKQEKNAEHLIRAFFQNFNPESSIVVRGKEAKLEIVFREPPMAIIDAINHCEVIELNYGKNLKEYEEDETVQVETELDSEQESKEIENSEQTEQESEESENSEHTKQESEEIKNSEQTEQESEESENSEQTEQESEESENSEQTEQESEENENSEQTEQESEESENSEQTRQESEENENSEQTEQESEENGNSEQTGKTRKKNGRPVTKKKEPTKTESKIISIPELKEIAKKATSFDDFAELVAKWLEMDKRQEFFKNLIIVSADVDKITWKELEKALKNNNIAYTQWDKIWSGQQVSEKLKEKSVTMLPLLNAIVEYKGYSFKQTEEQTEKENSTEQPTEETTENAEENSEEVAEAISSKPRVKMECMPEIKDFEETLASVDKTQPVEERVRYVLEAMGLSELPAKEQKQIIEIASTAVKKGRMAFDIIFVEAKIPIEQTMTARMTFSKFVNDFVQKYESGKKVKLLTFLSELQKIIMFESEIENFSDFTD